MAENALKKELPTASPIPLLARKIEERKRRRPRRDLMQMLGKESDDFPWNATQGIEFHGRPPEEQADGRGIATRSDKKSQGFNPVKSKLQKWLWCLPDRHPGRGRQLCAGNPIALVHQVGCWSAARVANQHAGTGRHLAAQGLTTIAVHGHAYLACAAAESTQTQREGQ